MAARTADTKSSATRAAILHAADRVLRTEGVHGFRVVAVAELAGISPGLIYYHFTNRDDLLRSTLGVSLAACTPYIPPVDLRDPVERTVDALGKYLGIAGQGATIDRIYAEGMRTAVFDPSLLPTLHLTIERWEAVVRESLAASIPSAEPERLRVLTTALTALSDGLQQRIRSGVLDAETARPLLEWAVRAAIANAGRDHVA